MTMTPKRLVSGSQIAATITTYFTATVPTRIDAMALTNTTASPVTVTLHLVPSGGTADGTNCILSAKAIPATGGPPYIVGSAIGQWMGANGTIQAVASVAGSVALVASGVEYS